MMKKVALFIIVLAALGMASNAAALSWQMYDFGTDPFDHNNNWAPYLYPHNVGELPSPGLLGEGGEKFDLEGFHFAMENNTVHLALTNSFGYSAYSTGWDQTYRQGDIFFGFNGEYYQYAIDISEGKLYEVDSYVGIPDKPGTYHDYPAIANAAGGWEIQSGTYLGDVDFTMTFWDDLETDFLQPGNGDTYVWEFAFDASLVGGFAGSNSISFHTTLECGNDIINESYNVIPEPITMILFGLGLIGAGAIRKKLR
jgi:hypothetical protein